MSYNARELWHPDEEPLVGLFVQRGQNSFRVGG